MSSTHSLATQVAVGIVLSLASIGVGYQVGSLSSSPVSITTGEVKNIKEDIEVDADEEGIPDGDLASVRAGLLEPCKMVLVVRTDLKMNAGDIASQCCQATLACYRILSKKNPGLVAHWERTGQAKIALKAKNEDQLQELEAIAKSLNLCAQSVRARGITGTTDGTSTVLAIGPAPVTLVNEVTGKLRLL